MPVSVIGTRGCGKSTFIGLLHQAMERYTNKNPGQFVFYMTPETSDRVLEIRNSLLRGEYPAATTRHQLEEIKFLLGFKPKTAEKIIQLAKIGFRAGKLGRYGNYLGMILSVFDISGEDIEEYRRTKTLYTNLKKVFDSDIVVILIDGSKFTNATKGRKYNRMLEYDREMATILSAYVEYRSKYKLKETLHPIFLITKADAIDAEIRDSFGLDKLSRKYNKADCNKIGNELLKTYMSAIRAAIYGAQRVGVHLEEGVYFYSWVEEEKVDGLGEVGAQHTLRVIRGSDGMARNVYPEHMYEAFLNHIRDLSDKYSDPKDLVEQIFGKTIKEDKK